MLRISIEPEQLNEDQKKLVALHGVLPEPVYGDQINNAAVSGVKPEAKVIIKTTTISGKYPDGTPYELIAPQYSLESLAYGAVHKDAKISPRIAPQVIGVGLLDVIAENDILKNVKKQSQREDGIRGRVNRVNDPFLGENTIGHFGWKANVGSLASQTALAFRGDIGITSSKVLEEACTQSQNDCLEAPTGADEDGFEITDRVFNEVVFYQSVLAPAARRHANSETVKQGEKLFHQADCAVCHRPSYVTGKSKLPKLSSRTAEGLKIWPYTDLLLHDMGEGLADNRSDGLATGREWKTPPLWGIGQIQAVNGHSQLLHDGRARNTEEAILWHGGEAENSKQQFKALSKQERDALIQFVDSL